MSCRLLPTRNASAPWPEYEGFYVDGMWVFDLPDDRPFFHLALDGQTASNPFPSDKVDITEAEAALSDAPISFDDGIAQRKWFDEGPQDLPLWDVIVVGQGMAGGVLNYQLAAEAGNLSVLGVDAGSLLFPCHVGNLPRLIYAPAAQGATTLWNTYPEFGVQPYQYEGAACEPDGPWAGREVFAFGGRSLFWGALAPRISDAELATYWPDTVAAELTTDSPAQRSWYAQAEALLAVGTHDGQLEKQATELLQRLMPYRENRPAPVAMQTERAHSWRVASGIFSTAALLLERRLASPNGSGGFDQPYIHLGELVTKVEPEGAIGDGPVVWKVWATRIRDGTEVVRRARAVVLSAGTIETSRIAMASELADLIAVVSPEASALVGQGLTEHPMYYVHFQIPPDSPYWRTRSSAKLLSTPGDSGDDWNMLLELGSDLVEGRAMPAGTERVETQVDEGCVAAQLVFLGRADLGPGSVEPLPEPWLKLNGLHQLPGVSLQIEPVSVDDDDLFAQWSRIAGIVVTALGGSPLPSSRTGLVPQAAQLGMVAHEVGTMRMASKRINAPGDDLQMPGVVDEDLQVIGCPGLFVCDNSVLPTSPSANPSLTLAALAMRLADHLKTYIPAATAPAET